MRETPDPETVDTEDEYIRVRYRDPDRYEASPPQMGGNRRRVRLGGYRSPYRETREQRREIQSVLVQKHVGEEKAREQADEIIQKRG